MGCNVGYGTFSLSSAFNCLDEVTCFLEAGFRFLLTFDLFDDLLPTVWNRFASSTSIGLSAKGCFV